MPTNMSSVNEASIREILIYLILLRYPQVHVLDPLFVFIRRKVIVSWLAFLGRFFLISHYFITIINSHN
jgi:hypothetical protein